MSRDTSVEAYNIIKNSKMLSDKRMSVYETLYSHGPLTASEIADAIPDFKSPSVGFNVHARLCELREMGAVKEVGKKSCTLTNMNVILWDVTSNVPKPYKRKLSNKEKINILGAACEQAISLLISAGMVDAAMELDEKLKKVS